MTPRLIFKVGVISPLSIENLARQQINSFDALVIVHFARKFDGVALTRLTTWGFSQILRANLRGDSFFFKFV
jgi:hypothetical protein